MKGRWRYIVDSTSCEAVWGKGVRRRKGPHRGAVILLCSWRWYVAVHLVSPLTSEALFLLWFWFWFPGFPSWGMWTRWPVHHPIDFPFPLTRDLLMEICFLACRRCSLLISHNVLVGLFSGNLHFFSCLLSDSLNPLQTMKPFLVFHDLHLQHSLL